MRYLIVGAWNTAFGYALGVFLYYALRDHFHLVAISIGGNIIAITMSYLTYKIFVFRTKGDWLAEYCRTYFVYGGSAIFGVFLLWFFVDGVGIPFWIAQALIVMVTVLISYVGHAKFTFQRPK